MVRKLASLVLLAALAPLSIVSAGGMAYIKVADLPKTVSAGQVVSVQFTVHDAVQMPMNKLKPTVIAQLGPSTVTVSAKRAKQPGAYVADVRFPAAGAWAITVDSHYCHNTCTVQNVQVLAAK